MELEVHPGPTQVSVMGSVSGRCISMWRSCWRISFQMVLHRPWKRRLPLLLQVLHAYTNVPTVNSKRESS